jgi:hypothetical protein
MPKNEYKELKGRNRDDLPTNMELDSIFVKEIV